MQVFHGSIQQHYFSDQVIRLSLHLLEYYITLNSNYSQKGFIKGFNFKTFFSTQL